MTPSDREGLKDPGADRPGDSHFTAAGVRSVDSQDLMRGGRVLIIRHGAEAYRLQITHGGKLILTK